MPLLEQYLTQLIAAAFFSGMPPMTRRDREKYFKSDPTKMYSWDRKHGVRIDPRPEG